MTLTCDTASPRYMLRDQIVIIVRLHRPGPALGTGTGPSAMISAQIAIFNIIIIICPSVSGGCVSELLMHRVQDSFPSSGYNPVHHKSVINHFTAPAWAGLVLASAASVLLLLASLCSRASNEGSRRFHNLLLVESASSAFTFKTLC